VNHRSLDRAPTAPRWSRAQIRAARLVPLGPLLEKRGFHLVETGADNFLVAAYPGLIAKDCYWRWPDRDLAGNAIDFCTQVLRLSFHDAMRELIGS
jgi:hypothetical protein